MGWSLRENMYQVIDKIKLMRSNLSILIKESIGARSQNHPIVIPHLLRNLL